MSKLTATLVCLGLIAAGTAALWGGGPAEPSLEEKKAIAGTQIEMIMLMIDKGEFDKIPAAFQKVIDLKFSGKLEKLVVDTIMIMSEELNGKKQEKISLKLVDMGLESLKEQESLARLYKEKGFIYKRLNMPDEAMKMFEKGRSLEGEQK